MIPLAAVCLVGGAVLGNLWLGAEPLGSAFLDSPKVLASIFCATGLVLFVLGLWLNEPRRLVLDVGDDGTGRPDPVSASEIAYRTKNSVYWIKIEYWGLIFIVCAIVGLMQ